MALIDALGHAHWGYNYEKFSYNKIPVLIKEYDPITQYQVSALWALWRLWAEYFFDNDSCLGRETDSVLEVRWLREAVKLMHSEYVKRIYELAAISQWMVIAKGKGRMREKQFLLVEIHKVNTNPTSISEGPEIPPELTYWIGNEYLVKVDRLYHRPLLKVMHNIWIGDLNALGGETPLSPPPLGPDYAS